jgi:hypothetical protein
MTFFLIISSALIVICHGWEWPWEKEELPQVDFHPLSDSMIDHINNQIQPHWQVEANICKYL